MDAAELPRIAGLTGLAELGRTGFAAVYRGDRDGHPVAVKVFQAPSLPADSRRRFDAEVAALAALAGHPCVVPIYGSGQLADGRPFLVMEYCPGGSLAAALAEGPLPVGATADVGERIAAALAAAHAAGITHRNVAPASVLLRASGDVALSDFGLSLRLEQAAVGPAVRPEYAAPETLGSGEYGPATDVYCLGLTLYALLAGVPPYSPRPGETPMAHVRRMFSEPPAALPRTDVPPELSGLLLRMLSPRPVERPAASIVTQFLAGEIAELPAPAGAAATPWAAAPPARSAAVEVVGQGAGTLGRGVGQSPAADVPGPYSGSVQPTAPEPATSVFPLLDAPPGPPLPPTGGQQRGGRRRAIVLAAVAGVAVGTVVALAITFTGSPAKKNTAAPPRTSTPAAPTTTAGDDGAGTPNGTQIVTGPRGLTLALPGDWTIKAVANGQQADDPNHPGEFAQFNAIPAAGGELLDSAKSMERKVQDDPRVSDYKQLIFRTTHYGNADSAVEWAYSFTADGTAQQSAGRVWRINGSDYSMFVNAPANDFQRVRRVFETMLNSAGPR
jgi:hypothetical protein